MMRFSLLVCFFLLAQTLSAKDFNILDFGAKGDGTTLNTTQIQAAIDAANKKGGGRVVIPAGRFLSGAVVLKTGVELHLFKDAVLLGSTDTAHYAKFNKWEAIDTINPNMSRWTAVVIAYGQQNIAITGKGAIDGQGHQLGVTLDSFFYAGQIDSADYHFAEMRPKFYLRPQLILFINCKGIKVSNVTLKNSSCWVQTYDKSENIVIDSIRVESDAYWNNDGMDISDCKNVRITNCFINAGDDAICLKSHTLGYYCDNIYVANCTVRSGASAIKFGARSTSGFKNVTIEHIKVYDTFRSVLAIECVDGGTLENVMVDDIQAVNTGNAIFIRLGKRKLTRPVGTLRNVTIKNIKVEIAFERPDYAYEMRAPALPFLHNIFPCSITGIPGHQVENVTLENIEISYPGRGNKAVAYLPLARLDEVPEKISEYPEFSMFGELPAWGFYVRHVNGLMMKNIKLSIKAPDYRPAFVFDDVQNLDISSTSISGDTKQKQFILHNTKDAKIENQQAVLIK